jgi:prevent-host-death family protein
MKINIHAAKTHFSRLLKRVAEGEEIVIARAGVPVARMVRAETAEAKRPLGMDRDSIVVDDDFDAPLPDDLMTQFFGGGGKTKGKSAIKKSTKRP